MKKLKKNEQKYYPVSEEYNRTFITEPNLEMVKVLKNDVSSDGTLWSNIVSLSDDNK